MTRTPNFQTRKPEPSDLLVCRHPNRPTLKSPTPNEVITKDPRFGLALTSPFSEHAEFRHLPLLNIDTIPCQHTHAVKIPPRRPCYLAVLLDLGITPRSIEIVHKTWPDAASLENVTESELRNRGVTPAQARRLRAAMDLAVLYHHHHHFADQEVLRYQVDSLQDVVNWVRGTIGTPDQEIFAVLNLDVRLSVISVTIAALGDVSRVDVSPPMVFRDAVRAMASKVVLIHNHPSGYTAPSDEDILLTDRMVEVGDLIGIHVLDHLVLGQGLRACSLAQEGYIPRRPR